MAEANKNTIYVDIDDEITALIDKVKASNGKVVALVLPKRASVLQSVVNMKLLKRTADNQKKNIVLITTEAGLLPLAGAVGLHVAKSLSSKPEIPVAPNLMGGAKAIPGSIDEDMSLPLDEEEMPDLTAQAGAATSVGALAEAAHMPYSPSKNDSLETVELDNGPIDSLAEDLAVGASATTLANTKTKKNKNLKVPNFDRFRLLLIIGILVLVALIVLGYFALNVLPHAVIDVTTNASNVNTSLNLTLDSQAQTVTISSGDIPATQATQQKTFTQTVNTTGQKNEGTAATGSVTMTASDCSTPPTYGGKPSFVVPQGTGLSANNNTYITQADTTLSYTGLQNNCFTYTATNPTQISAQNPGSSYNISTSTTFAVAGYPGVSATGSATGGTDSLVQIVSQNDVNTASSKINASNSGSVKQDLVNQLKGQGLYPVEVTFTSDNPQTSSNPNVGSTSSTVTVTETITYAMFGAYQSDFNSVLSANIASQTAKGQNIINNGLNASAFKQIGTNGTTDQVSLSTVATVGPNISAAQIQKQSEGKSPQTIISAIKNNPDVTSVTVRLSPFWVSSAPNNPAKITVKVAKP